MAGFVYLLNEPHTSSAKVIPILRPNSYATAFPISPGKQQFVVTFSGFPKHNIPLPLNVHSICISVQYYLLLCTCLQRVYILCSKFQTCFKVIICSQQHSLYSVAWGADAASACTITLYSNVELSLWASELRTSYNSSFILLSLSKKPRT